jgi:hypothetical protein
LIRMLCCPARSPFSAEAISGQGRQINKRARVVKESQAPARASSNVRKAWHRVALEDCFGIASAKTTNHLFGIMVARATLVNASRSTACG